MKLPIFQCVMEAYGELFAHPKMYLLGTAITLPVIVLLPEAFLQWDLMPYWGHLFWPTLKIAPYILFALVWLRLLLNGERRQRVLDRVLGNDGVTCFARSGLLLLFLWLPFIETVPIGVAAMMEIARSGWTATTWEGYSQLLLNAALALAWGVFLARFSIAIPSAARSDSITLRSTWSATAESTFRLPAAYLIATIPLLIAAMLVYSKVGFGAYYYQPPLDRITGKLFSVPFELAAAAVFVNVAASAYRRLPGSSPGHDQTLMRFE